MVRGADGVVDELGQGKGEGMVPLCCKVLVVACHSHRLGVWRELDALGDRAHDFLRELISQATLLTVRSGSVGPRPANHAGTTRVNQGKEMRWAMQSR